MSEVVPTPGTPLAEAITAAHRATLADMNKATHTPATTAVFWRVVEALAVVPAHIKHNDRAIVGWLKKAI